METDLPDGEHPEKTQEPQGDNLAPDGVKEGSAKDGTGSELKKRKLDEDVRASVDASNSGSLESASKRKRIPIPVPGTKPLDVTKPITQVSFCAQKGTVISSEDYRVLNICFSTSSIFQHASRAHRLS